MVDRRRREELTLRRLALLCPLVALALAGGVRAATKTYSSHQLHTAIPDGGTLDKSISVPDAGPVSFAAVGVRIVHPRDSDLTISLLSPFVPRVKLVLLGPRHHDPSAGPAGTVSAAVALRLPRLFDLGCGHRVRAPARDHRSRRRRRAGGAGRPVHGRGALLPLHSD